MLEHCNKNQFKKILNQPNESKNVENHSVVISFYVLIMNQR